MLRNSLFNLRICSSAFKSVGLSLALILLTTSSCGLKPAKDDAVGVRNWVIVPVFYSTNRKRLASAVNGAIAYSDDPNNTGPLFGMKNIAVPAPSSDQLTPAKLKQLSWQEVVTEQNQAGQAPSVVAEKCPLKDQTFTKEEAVRSFKSYTLATNTHDSVIFVHGCCANFDTSIKRAAKIAAHMGVPVLLYDWVSPVGFERYLQNETRVKQTMDHFCRFLNNVDKVADPGTVTLLGHSMGAQFLDEAMIRRAIKSSCGPLARYREIIMCNGDTDAQSFLEHGQEFTDNAAKVRIYISSKDDRLLASSFAHGRFPRLGEPGAYTDQLTKIKGAEVIDITEAGTDHEIPFGVVAAVHANDSASLKPEFDLEQRGPNFLYLKKTGPTRTTSNGMTVNNKVSTSCATCP